MLSKNTAEGKSLTYPFLCCSRHALAKALDLEQKKKGRRLDLKISLAKPLLELDSRRGRRLLILRFDDALILRWPRAFFWFNRLIHRHRHRHRLGPGSTLELINSDSELLYYTRSRFGLDIGKIFFSRNRIRWILDPSRAYPEKGPSKACFRVWCVWLFG